MGFRVATEADIRVIVQRRVDESIVPVGFRLDNLHETLPYAFFRGGGSDKNQDSWFDIISWVQDLCGQHRTRGRDAGNELYWPCWGYDQRERQWDVVLFFHDQTHAAAFRLRWC